MPETKDKTRNSEQRKVPLTLHTAATSVRKRLETALAGRFAVLRESKWQRWAVITLTSLVAASMMAPTSFHVYNLAVGEPAKETIVSPISFKANDEAATNKNRDEALKAVLPVYDFDDVMARDVETRIISAFTFMNEYLAREAAAREARREQPPETAEPADKTQPQPKLFRALDDNELRTRFENLIGASVSSSAFTILKANGFNPRIPRDLASLVVPVLIKGVVLSRELVMRDGKKGIHLWLKSQQKLELLKDPSTLFDLKEATNFINVEDKGSTVDPALSKAVRRLAMDLINVNITYNREQSAARRKAALDSVKDVFFEITKGETIIKKGEPVNEGHLKKLAGLANANPPYRRYMILAGFALTLILLLQLSFFHIEKHSERSRNANADLFIFCVLLVGSVALARFFAALPPFAMSAASGAGEAVTARSILYAAPMATGPMLIAQMVNGWTAFIFAVLSAVTGTLAVEGELYLFCYYLLSGIVGIQGMGRIMDRTSVVRAGLLTGLVNVCSVVAIKMALAQLAGKEDLMVIGFAFGGGFLSGLLVLGLAPLLEPLGYTTNVRLLELANLNHSLLKKMSLEAPGTYHHSIMVGNLAEAAAEQIGANPLLARVGAYYHDIGKVGKKSMPSYFIENQQRGINPHDKLEPSMSALILVSHVKHGVELAREHRLGWPIIDIIQQHHGSNLIRYFYSKALERVDKDHSVSEDKYRYPGPRPQTKEAALVMMADVVEAACRTLNDPTPSRIQKRVQSLIMGMFSEGQLDQSTLTLKDLHSVTRSFVRALQGILHSRVEYPDDAKVKERQNGDTSGQPTERDRNRIQRADEDNGAVIRRLGM